MAMNRTTFCGVARANRRKPTDFVGTGPVLPKVTLTMR